jgi:beta-glucosidase
LPSASSLGATFDPVMASLYGRVTGNDAVMYGYDGIWGPTLNTLRTPLAGRGEEYFGEDPYLISQMAIAEVRAEQAAGAMSQIKHFVANDQEGQDGVPIFGGSLGGRQFVNVIADERTLHEVYLAPFEATIAEADPASIMCSYNKLNGPYACESSWLLQTVLRDQFGFQGWVSPDFGADHNHLSNFNAGMDAGYMSTPNDVDAYLTAGQVTRAQLDDHARHILRSFFDHGVFDREPYTDRHTEIDVAGEQQIAQQIEEQGATLLLNRDNALPLDDSQINTIAVIGQSANRYVRGSGSPEVAPFFHQTLLQGIQERAGSNINVVYDDGTNPVSAAAVAQSADVAIVSAADAETEGDDKRCMALDCPSVGLGDLQGHDPQQSDPLPDELISSVAAAQPRTVVVLQTGEPVLTPWRDEVAGLLEAWYPGEAGGTAIARILFGDVEPGGRLSSTFPISDQDGPATSVTKNPSQYPGDAQENEYYSEGVLVGHRWYDANDLEVAFPFGFGLSYTTTEMSNLHVNPTTDGAEVSVTVTNTGDRRGWAVPQLYVGLPQPSEAVVEPPSQLRGFDKLSLAGGESRTVTFTLGQRDFAYWDTSTEDWRVAPGCTTIKVGSSSRDLPLEGQICSGDLSVSLSDTPDPVVVGAVLTYEATVTNNGFGDARGVGLTDVLPKNVRLRSARSDHGHCVTTRLRRLECNLAELAPGESATVTIQVRPTKAGTIVDSAVVSASQPVDPNLANNSATETTTVER